MASGSGSPCGACKFLRRKCADDCVFAPYFCSEQGPARFAAIHKVFGASNVSKLLLHVPAADRCEAVVTIAYEAQARIRDPVYGCVAHIFALQQQVPYPIPPTPYPYQASSHLLSPYMFSFCDSFNPYNRLSLCFLIKQVACLQAQLMQLRAQLANNMGNLENQWQGNVSGVLPSSFQNFPGYMNSSSGSPQCSMESIEQNSDGMGMQEFQSRDDFSFQTCSRKRPPHNDLGELQELALRMMRN